jgi:dTDP-4-amino-4,6-dideoxygalactose transaminase/GNAT superfamily N-acetyltransferase
MKHKLFKVFMSPNASERVQDVLNSGMITQGEKVEEFERQLKEYFNYPYILTLNSGTSGLTLALRLIVLETPPERDEIITTALTCTATNWPILANNLKIKWVDVDETTCNISLKSIEEKISEKTKAIMIVHWGGYPVDLDELYKIIERAERKYGYKIPVIQDCAHAFGAKYYSENDEINKFLGTHSSLFSLSVYSLQAIKHLTSGDGGLIFLPNQELYEKAKKLRWFGIDREKRTSPGGDFRMEEDISEWGYKFHMNDINASIGLANLPFVQKNIDRLQEINKIYREYLKNISGVELLTENSNSESSCWLFTMKVSNKLSFIKFMGQKEIMVSQVHNRNDRHSCVSQFQEKLPNLDSLEKQIICIPAGWWLNDEDIKYILDSVAEWSSYEHPIRELNECDYHKNFLILMNQLNGYEYSKLSFDEFREKLNLCCDKNTKIFVKEINNKIIATCKVFIEYKFGDNIAHIEDLVVDENYRSKNIGSELLNFTTNFIFTSHSNVYKILLNCSDDLEKFYDKNSFSKEGLQMVLRK